MRDMADESNRVPPTDPSAAGPSDQPGAQPSGDRTEPADAERAAAPIGEPADARLTEAQARAAEFQDAYLRARAEMENVRRRAQDDLARAHKFAVESFAESLLPVADSLEAALKVDNASTEAMRSGVELTLRQLVAAFEKNRLVPIDPTGQRFDPNLHQAISMVPSDTVPAQHVVATLQKGFTIAERVLRPALVTVSQGPQSGA